MQKTENSQQLYRSFYSSVFAAVAQSMVSFRGLQKKHTPIHGANFKTVTVLNLQTEYFKTKTETNTIQTNKLVKLKISKITSENKPYKNRETLFFF